MLCTRVVGVCMHMCVSRVCMCVNVRSSCQMVIANRECMRACVRACVHACKRACVHACMCMHACMRACVRNVLCLPHDIVHCRRHQFSPNTALLRSNLPLRFLRKKVKQSRINYKKTSIFKTQKKCVRRSIYDTD